MKCCNEITLCIDQVAGPIEMDVEKQGGNAPVYEGPYDVTPKVTAQTLATQDKLMAEDVNVRAIPYNQVRNPQGGDTVSIGNEL